MQSIKVKCPAKINLTLEVVNRREDGYNNIKSIMQLISLYDYLTISVKSSDKTEINLSGTSSEIPYNEKNLIHKAAVLFFQKANINNVCVNVFLEKNIPIAAGLAGGSTDAAGMLWGLNKIFNSFSYAQLEDLCAQLGSDLNVCLNGGCTLATSRGEITQKLPNIQSDVSLIKPKNLGISAREAYQKYTEKEFKPKYNNTEKMIDSIKNGKKIDDFLYNDLEYAIFDDYTELQNIKKAYPESIMSGSGSTYFILQNITDFSLDENYLLINNLKFIPDGVGFADM
jgi:4-diphosphocytidyl-2-C-methyl-D-erythritol kinase